MNEKEMNQAILAELKRIANEVFAKVEVSKEGTYTAAELWNGKNSMGEKIEIFYMGTESDVYTAKVDTFEFQVSAQDVFFRLWKFEQLCRVRQENKARFTYGEAEHEIVNEKAMYYTGQMERGYYDENNGCSPVIGEGNYKVVTRKVTLKKLSDKLALDKKEIPYYKAGGMWYLINDRELSEKTIERIKNEPDYLFGLLSKWDYSVKCELNAIFKALFEALKSERVNNTPEQRKSENEPEKSVICESEKIDTSAKDFNKHESLKATEKRMREYHPNYIALIRYDGMYYSYGESAKNVRLSDGVRDYITDTGDYICFPESLLDDVLPKLIKAGRGVLTCDIIENEPQQDDYPPEPYNKEKSENVASLATFKTRNVATFDAGNVATSGKRMKDRTICGRFQKNMRPNYLRQKVFPAELFNERCKISRFKPRYFVGYTNYHLHKESALEQKRNGNTSVYMALIRGETKNNILICRQTCFRL